MKQYIIKILHLIRKILTFLKDEMLPIPNRKKVETFNIKSNKVKTAYEFYVEDEIKSSYEHFKKYFHKAVFLKKWFLREHAMQTELTNHQKDYFYLEFGVFRGYSLNFFSRILKRKNISIYGFDSFAGLNEDWLGTTVIKGAMDLKQKVPPLNNNCIPIVGLVEETLPKFISEKKNLKINFVHMDLDVYSSSKFVLSKIKPYLTNNAIIILDNIYNKPAWQHGEYKALTETFNEDEYRFISFGSNRESAAIKVTK